MEKLIKIQAVINLIEEMSLDPKYRSVFNYTNENCLEIETFCREQRITYEMLLQRFYDTAVYAKDNAKLEILELSRHK